MSIVRGIGTAVGLFWQHFEDMDHIELWFQQEGAVCHIRMKNDITCREISAAFILKNPGSNEFVRSHNSTSCDFLSWVYRDSKVYANNSD